jgi:hypothetical protein
MGELLVDFFVNRLLLEKALRQKVLTIDQRAPGQGALACGNFWTGD